MGDPNDNLILMLQSHILHFLLCVEKSGSTVLESLWEVLELFYPMIVSELLKLVIDCVRIDNSLLCDEVNLVEIVQILNILGHLSLSKRVLNMDSTIG